METRSPQPAVVPPAPAAPQVAPARSTPPRRLPRSVEQLLTWLRPEDENKVETLLCGMPLTKELVLAARFLDQVWTHARNAEYRVGAGRISGADMDLYYERFQASVKELVSIGVELAKRAGLTEIVQRHKKILGHHGFQPNGQQKAAAPKPAVPKVGPKAPEKDAGKLETLAA